MMEQHRITYSCFLCCTEFQYGPHIYDGSYVKAWDIMTCNRCRRANWDGILPGSFPQLEKHFRERGLQPEMNAKGWIEWPSN
jgi:hypothetical protein